MSMDQLLQQINTRAYNYRQLAFQVGLEIEQMGDAVARERPYKDKKHEQSYVWYQKHFTEMANFNEAQAQKLLEQTSILTLIKMIIHRVRALLKRGGA